MAGSAGVMLLGERVSGNGAEEGEMGRDVRGGGEEDEGGGVGEGVGCASQGEEREKLHRGIVGGLVFRQ